MALTFLPPAHSNGVVCSTLLCFSLGLSLFLLRWLASMDSGLTGVGIGLPRLRLVLWRHSVHRPRRALVVGFHGHARWATQSCNATHCLTEMRQDDWQMVAILHWLVRKACTTLVFQQDPTTAANRRTLRSWPGVPATPSRGHGPCLFGTSRSAQFCSRGKHTLLRSW